MLLHNAAYSVPVDTFEKDIWVIKREKRHFFEKKVHFFVIFFGGLLFLVCRVKEFVVEMISPILKAFSLF